MVLVAEARVDPVSIELYNPLFVPLQKWRVTTVFEARAFDDDERASVRWFHA